MKMQDVDFRDLNEFLDYLPEDERAITEACRNLIYACLPEIREKLSYNVPYYRRHKTLCFLWPGSVLWGKRRMYDGVRFGFTYGTRLVSGKDILILDQRKSVGYADLKSMNAIDTEQLSSMLYESYLLDEEDYRQKKKR